MLKNILCLILFISGTSMVWSQSGAKTYLGVFLLMWANNIAFAQQIEKLRNKNKIIAEDYSIEIDDMDETMSKISDK